MDFTFYFSNQPDIGGYKANTCQAHVIIAVLIRRLSLEKSELIGYEKASFKKIFSNMTPCRTPGVIWAR